MKSLSGYQVWYVALHSGWEKLVYWSADFDEASDYARMVSRQHGHTTGVYIATDEDGKICEWSLQYNESKAYAPT